MRIKLKRVYEKPGEKDGMRVLVERLWPRGLSKSKAGVDLWLKELAPSTELRKWFGHDRSKWEEFRKLYFAELEDKKEALNELTDILRKQDVTFVYASKEEKYNNSVALKEYLERHHKNQAG